MQKIGLEYTKEQLLDNLKDFFNQKASDYNLDLVFLYGSWARGFPRVDSDVDIAIKFSDKNLTDDQMFDVLNKISIDLAAETGKEVNLLPVFPDFRKPMLYYNAIVLGKAVYVKDTESYARFFVEAICQMEDFSLFGLKWQNQAALKNLEKIKHG